MNRKEKITGISGLETRKKIWESAKTAEYQNIELAEGLKKQALSMIDAIENATNLEQAAKLLQQSSIILEKGIKTEREAYRELTILHETCPR